MTEVLANIPFEINLNGFLKKNRVPPDSEHVKVIVELVDRVAQVARPKALYREAFIDARDNGSVTIDGITFFSNALRLNLAETERVFPYVATCGEEVEHIDIPIGDLLAQYWLAAIKEKVLGCSRNYLYAHLERKYALGKIASMNPGAGDIGLWPIEQQKELFRLFGDVQGLIGVRLTDSCLMIPSKTISGICFATQFNFRSCQLCRRDRCPERRARFKRELWESVQKASQRTSR